MNESRKPTLAAIEAALSDYNTTPSVDPTTDELSDDVKPFWTSSAAIGKALSAVQVPPAPIV